VRDVSVLRLLGFIKFHGDVESRCRLVLLSLDLPFLDVSVCKYLTLQYPLHTYTMISFTQRINRHHSRPHDLPSLRMSDSVLYFTAIRLEDKNGTERSE
jgi:hypothetical protein